MDPVPVEALLNPVIYLIDLETFTASSVIYSGHTDSNPYTFRYPDVSDQWVVNGSLSEGGFLWSRTYGCLLGILHNGDGVNCVALNPVDPEMAVTVGDNGSVKLWLSKRRMKSSPGSVQNQEASQA